MYGEVCHYLPCRKWNFRSYLSMAARTKAFSQWAAGPAPTGSASCLPPPQSRTLRASHSAPLAPAGTHVLVEGLDIQGTQEWPSTSTAITKPRQPLRLDTTILHYWGTMKQNWVWQVAITKRRQVIWRTSEEIGERKETDSVFFPMGNTRKGPRTLMKAQDLLVLFFIPTRVICELRGRHVDH